MRKLQIMVLCVAAVTGCAVFRQPGSQHQNQNGANARPTTPVDVEKMEAVKYGDWVRIELLPDRGMIGTMRMEKIGKVSRVSDDSMTLTEVSTRRFTTEHGGMSVLGQLSKPHESVHSDGGNVTLNREQIGRIRCITAKQAEELKHPAKEAKENSAAK